MNILVFNCGSSSLTFKVFQVDLSGKIDAVLSGKANRVGVKGDEHSSLETHDRDGALKEIVELPDHRSAATLILRKIKARQIETDLVGHRFVHGGSYFRKSVPLTRDTLERLQLCLPLAPVHNPNALSVIHECLKSLPRVAQFVAFDSAFHATMPPVATTYALPRNVVKKYGFRKYGFHGLSYQYVVREALRFLKLSGETSKIVACHLGTGGSSVCAILGGRSIDTSMGYSPLPGLVMSTRSGDVDPMLALYLMAVYGYASDEVMELFSQKSGLLGISGFTSDIRDVIHRMTEGEEEQAELAFNMYIHRVKKYIGSFIIALGGIDALIFTDDIGVHNPLVREKVCDNMQWCGIVLDHELNSHTTGDAVAAVESKDSRAHILSIPTEEELVICQDGMDLSQGA